MSWEWELSSVLVGGAMVIAVVVGCILLATRKPRSGMVRVDMENHTATAVEETDEGKLYAKIASGKCPDCGHKDGFLEGPSGGLSTKIFCVNRECRAGFNITPMIGTAERIHKGDLERYPKAEAST